MQERNVISGLFNYVNVIDGQRKTISLSGSSVLGNKRGRRIRGERRCGATRMKWSKTLCASGCVFFSLHVQGV